MTHPEVSVGRRGGAQHEPLDVVETDPPRPQRERGVDAGVGEGTRSRPRAPSAVQVKVIEDVVECLLKVRAENIAAGVSLARQYDTLRQPGRSQLRSLHAELDGAVAAAYGFTSDDDPLAQLLALNLDLADDPT